MFAAAIVAAAMDAKRFMHLGYCTLTRTTRRAATVPLRESNT